MGKAVGAQLLLRPQAGPVGTAPVHACLEGRQLAGQEGQTGIHPRPAPGVQQTAEQRAVMERLVRRAVGLSLIPQYPAEPIGRDPRHHVVEQRAGHLRITQGSLRHKGDVPVLPEKVQRVGQVVRHIVRLVDLCLTHRAHVGLKGRAGLVAQAFPQGQVILQPLAGIGLRQHVLRGQPALNARTAPVALNHAHGHLQPLGQHGPEHIPDGGKLRRVVPIRLLPGCVQPLGGKEMPASLGFVTAAAGDALQAHVGFCCAISPGSAALHAHQWLLHVGLAARQPYLAAGHVGEGHGLRPAGNGHAGDFPGAGGVDPGDPPALCIRQAGGFLRPQADGDRAACRDLAPHGVQPGVPQHHVVGEDVRDGQHHACSLLTR